MLARAQTAQPSATSITNPHFPCPQIRDLETRLTVNGANSWFWNKIDDDFVPYTLVIAQPATIIIIKEKTSTSSIVIAVVGAVVGVLFLLAVCVGVALGVWCCRRRSRKYAAAPWLRGQTKARYTGPGREGSGIPLTKDASGGGPGWRAETREWGGIVVLLWFCCFLCRSACFPRQLLFCLPALLLVEGGGAVRMWGLPRQIWWFGPGPRGRFDWQAERRAREFISFVCLIPLLPLLDCLFPSHLFFSLPSLLLTSWKRKGRIFKGARGFPCQRTQAEEGKGPWWGILACVFRILLSAGHPCFPGHLLLSPCFVSVSLNSFPAVALPFSHRSPVCSAWVGFPRPEAFSGVRLLPVLENSDAERAASGRETLARAQQEVQRDVNPWCRYRIRPSLRFLGSTNLRCQPIRLFFIPSAYKVALLFALQGDQHTNAESGLS
jgi:hypothetical protein